MSASQGTHSVTPLLPGDATRLLPPVDQYLPGEFQGVWDIRLWDQANILRVVVWLHCLDLAATYGRAVLDSPDAGEYDMGPLWEYFLAPQTSGLTFREIADRVTQENHEDIEGSLRELVGQCEELQEAVEFLTQSQDRESNKETKKSLKKRLDSMRKELHSLESQISEKEFLLGHKGSGDTTMAPPQRHLDVIVEGKTVEIVGEGDAQSEGATPESTANPPEGEQEQEPMETNPLASPVSPTEDNLLTGATAATTGVETELASFWVTSSPEDGEGQQQASG